MLAAGLPGVRSDHCVNRVNLIRTPLNLLIDSDSGTVLPGQRPSNEPNQCGFERPFATRR